MRLHHCNTDFVAKLFYFCNTSLVAAAVLSQFFSFLPEFVLQFLQLRSCCRKISATEILLQNINRHSPLQHRVCFRNIALVAEIFCNIDLVAEKHPRRELHGSSFVEREREIERGKERGGKEKGAGGRAPWELNPELVCGQREEERKTLQSTKS